MEEGSRGRLKSTQPGDVLVGQQRKRAHFHQRLSGRVRVQGRHPGQARVQREEQVEALLGPDLAHEDRSLAEVAYPYVFLDATY